MDKSGWPEDLKSWHIGQEVSSDVLPIGVIVGCDVHPDNETINMLLVKSSNRKRTDPVYQLYYPHELVKVEPVKTPTSLNMSDFKKIMNIHNGLGHLGKQIDTLYIGCSISSIQSLLTRGRGNDFRYFPDEVVREAISAAKFVLADYIDEISEEVRAVIPDYDPSSEV